MIRGSSKSKKSKSSQENSGSIQPYGRYGNAGKTSKTISTIAILWPVKAIFERAAMVEVDAFIYPAKDASQAFPDGAFFGNFVLKFIVLFAINCYYVL